MELTPFRKSLDSSGEEQRDQSETYLYVEFTSPEKMLAKSLLKFKRILNRALGTNVSKPKWKYCFTNGVNKLMLERVQDNGGTVHPYQVNGISYTAWIEDRSHGTGPHLHLNFEPYGFIPNQCPKRN